MDLEPEIQALARRLLEASEPREPITLTPEWWQERLLDWATGDPDFRIKLLRFVDVLPALRSARAVADHIRQYFPSTGSGRGPSTGSGRGPSTGSGRGPSTGSGRGPADGSGRRRGPAPALVNLGSGLATQPLFRPVVSHAVRQGVYSMARRFIAGETPDDAVSRLRDLTREGVAYTVDLLGEATLSEVEADAYLGRYLDLMKTLATKAPGPDSGAWTAVPRVNISIKLSALYSQFEAAAPEAVSAATRERLRPLLRAARDQGAFVNVDMEQYRFKDLVFHVFADVMSEPEFASFADVGIVVQAYLKDAGETIARLRDLASSRGAPFGVRLVKGAYWEEERIVASQSSWDVPVFEEKAATDASYERCTDALLAAWPHLRPAFGTHNHRSIAQAAVKARARGLPDAGIEFQMLYGMAEELRAAVAGEGHRTRVYVPVGRVIPGMAYLVRRLLENTSNQSWFLREATAVSPDELVAPPQDQATVLGQAQDGRVKPLSLHPEPVEGPAVFTNAPPAPFHEPDMRAAMRTALDRFQGELGQTHPVLIGRDKPGRRETAEVRYPADPSLLLGRVMQATPSDVDRAVQVACEAFPSWRDRPASGRAALLRRAAVLMSDRRFELAATMVFESAKPWREADGDVAEAIDYLNYYAAEAERLAEPRRLGDVLGEENEYLLEARGVAAVIAPWNFPLAIICGMSSAALAAGNCAILKPAAQSPIIAFELVQILREAGIPDGAVHYLPGPGSRIGQALVEHPGVDIIAFTGSKEVGLGIVATAAQTRPGQRGVKRVIAEMGGKNAIIVDDDADLDQAVAGVITSAFGYAGQKCSACSRLVIVGSAYDETLARLAPAVESLVVGPPHDPSTFVPPLISAGAREKVQAYIDGGKESAKLLAEGAAPEGPGHYVRPTVFTEVDRGGPLAREEIFGPVLSVFRAADFSEALAIALDSDFALTGGLYSRNPRNIEQARREFRVGDLYINRKITGAVVGRQPFGGLGLSGVGDKAGGPDYLLQFMRPRLIAENTMRRGFAPS